MCLKMISGFWRNNEPIIAALLRAIPFITFLFLSACFCHQRNNNFRRADSFDIKKIAVYQTEDLISLLGSSGGISEEDQDAIIGELINRRPVKEALMVVTNSTDAHLRLNLYRVLSSLDDPLIVEAFRKSNITEVNEESFYCLVYLARKGDKTALSTLNKNYGKYPVSTQQWIEVVKLFGQWNYKEATQHLLSTVDSMNLNLADASIESLLKIYPKAPSTFNGYEDAKNQLEKYLHEIDSNK